MVQSRRSWLNNAPRTPPARSKACGPEVLCLLFREQVVDLIVGIRQGTGRCLPGNDSVHGGRHNGFDLGGVVGDGEQEGGAVLDVLESAKPLNMRARIADTPLVVAISGPF